MITKVSDIVPLVASLVGDDPQDFATLAYQLPKFRVAQNQLITSLLENPNIGDIKAVVEVSNVAVGTTSLRAFGSFDLTGPLYLLKDVLTMEEKRTGAGNQEYLEMDRMVLLPAIVPGQLNQVYAWTSQDILLLGATQAVDFRIFGTFEPAVLSSGDSVLIPGTATIIQYRVAQLIAQIRGNAALAVAYRNDANDAEDSHFTNIIMAQQKLSIRQRSFSPNGENYPRLV